MASTPIRISLIIRVILLASMVCWLLLFTDTGMAAPPLEYCGDRMPDQQLGATSHPERYREGHPHAGCVPLSEQPVSDEQTPPAQRKLAPTSQNLKIEHLQTDVSNFLHEYREFLRCCQTDPSELERVEELGHQIGALLELAQSGLFSEQMKLRGMTLKEMIAPVASARHDLMTLRKQLEQLGAMIDNRAATDYGAIRRETGAIEEAQESLQKNLRPYRLPSGPKTGLEIGSTPSSGRDIGKTPTSGTAIGAEGLSGPHIGVNPKTGREIGATGPTGFEIGATGRAGPDIGESQFNSAQSSSAGSTLRQSTIGSTLQDSTIGSNIGKSTAGSSLQDSSVGSTLGGSSVGSSLQNRGTGPQ